MRRVLAIGAVLAAASTVAFLGTGAGDGGSPYQVRAIFRNAFSLVPGEDVKIAGVRVGKIDSLDVTPSQQAAVVLTITRPGFGDFRTDAECTIRPQSLIGEKFVECTPTQPRAVGEAPAPPLPAIPDGRPGAGQHLLPVGNTSRPVDLDLVNNIMRLPYRQRLGIIINEFGTGLAARGGDLRRVIRDADPALKATDRVLNLLARQDKVIADLAKQSDVSLAPLARERRRLQGFVDQAAGLATATAQRQQPFRAQFQKLPALLRELRPTMARLGGFSDQATPVLRDLGAQAPAIGRLVKAMGPFSSSATASLTSLGEATVPGRRALVAARGIVGDLRTFGRRAKPLTRNLSALLTSFKQTGGIERLLDYAFYQVAAINGFDGFGHYLRASLIVNLCSTYATQSSKDAACSANFQGSGARAASSAMTALQALRQPGISLVNRRTAAVLRGMSPQEAIRLTAGERDPAATPAPTGAAAGQQVVAAAGTQAAPAGAGAAAAGGGSAAPATDGGAAATTGAGGASQRLLDYLLGGGA